MPIEVTLPALSASMTEGTLINWLKAEGDTVSVGEVLVEIETDKATLEVESANEGRVGKIVVPAGTENVAVGATIAWLLGQDEDASALDNPAPAAESVAKVSPEPIAQTVAESTANSEAAGKQTGEQRIFASPLARRLARQDGLDLAHLQGSGPRGRIVKKDINAALSSREAPEVSVVVAESRPSAAEPNLAFLPEHQAIANSGMRKTIARRLTESSQQVPHIFLSVDCELDALLAFRRDLNARSDADYRLSVNDLVTKSLALALSRVPEANVMYTEAATLQFSQVDISIAVAIEGGLITPVVKDVAGKGLATLSREIRELVSRAREGKLTPDEYQGGTFSLSNLGMHGVKQFTSIINPPQGGILSIGRGEQRPVVRDGELAVATVMTVTLAVDHRCIDGAVAARLLEAFKGIVEEPISMVL